MKLSNYEYKPGQSGNPSGISKEMAQKIRACRMKALDECPAVLDVINTVSRGGFELGRSQMWAMQQLLDRGMGRAHQAMTIEQLQQDTEEKMKFIDMTTDQVKMLAANRTAAFLVDLYEKGQLKDIVKRLDSGWRGE